MVLGHLREAEGLRGQLSRWRQTCFHCSVVTHVELEASVSCP